jgi:hypothetical protein
VLLASALLGAARRKAEESGGMAGTIFGYTEAEIAEFGLTFGLTAFMLYMLFIIGELAWKSKAGKMGTFILFFVLAFGMLGFAAKAIIKRLWGI